MNRKVVVTGGAGFIGSHLAKKLVVLGHEVIVIDNLCEGNKNKLKPYLKELTFVKEDVRNLEGLKKVFKGVDTVFHEAALRSVKRSVDNPLATHDNNINGTLSVYEAARRRGVRRVVVASSSSVYGTQKARVFRENLCPNPQSPYALSKLCGEVYGRLYYSLYQTEVVNLRYFNVFGPGQDPESQYAAVIPLFIKLLLQKRPGTIHWDGQQSRDFTYIDNVVAANLQVMKQKSLGGEVINVAAGDSYSINHVYRMVEKIIGVKIKPVRTEKREGDVRYTRGSNEKATKLLKYQQKINFETGLKKTVEWFNQNLKN